MGRVGVDRAPSSCEDTRQAGMLPFEVRESEARRSQDGRCQRELAG